MQFGKFPLLRLLLPFVGGILLYVYVSDHWISADFWHNLSLLLLFIVVLIVLLVLNLFFRLKFIISLMIDIGLVLFGYELSYYQDTSHHPNFLGREINTNEKAYLIVKPSDVVLHKEKYNRLIFDVCRVFSITEKNWKNTRGKIMVYVSDNIPIDSMFHPNAYYLLNVRLKNIADIHNPYLFNYSEYLKRQGIYHTATIKDKRDVQYLCIQKSWGIQEWALFARYKIIEYFKHNRFLNKDGQSIAIAFLTGFDDEMDNNIIQSFIYSGTMHILSVSGFHTGLLFLLISFIFSLIDPYEKRKWLRLFVIVFCLFFYAFISGFSAPIVRAAIMLSLAVLHRYFYTDRIIHPLNILSAAAFFVLTINPLYINDAGFLLSFSAMIGLMYFSPKYHFENRIIQSIWDIVSMSVGAQLATLPVALYFFHSFAFLFILANLVIIPLSTIIMFVSIAALIPLSFISIVLNKLIGLLIYLNHYFYKIGAYYDWIHFTFTDSLMLSVLLVGGYIVFEKIRNKEKHWIAGVNFVVLIVSIWILIHWLQSIQTYQKRGIYVYSDKEKMMCWIEKSNRITFNHLDSAALRYWARDMLLKNHIQSFRIYSFNYVYCNNTKILIGNNLKDTVLIKSIRPDILIWNNKQLPAMKYLDIPELKTIYWTKKNNRNKEKLPSKMIAVSDKEIIKIADD
ncbi:MAG: ComEC/Rec2 family competence protein [Bacteroidia bacterium]